jgi:hypothetical protein
MNGQAVYQNYQQQQQFQQYQPAYLPQPIISPAPTPVMGTPVYNIYSNDFGYNQQASNQGAVLIFANDEAIKKGFIERKIK